MLPVIAIVGRPNVGKSTLFNRLIGSRQALVDDRPGVTRDRNYGTTEFNEREVILIDTGGFEPVPEDDLFAKIRVQAEAAIQEADIIL
ncbi:MAG: GTP-binding protein, partial [Myxococcota bacterium]